MTHELNSSMIPYQEHYALVTLMHAHREVHGENLRAMVAFGDLVTVGEPYDIQLLEVVDEWDGPGDHVFASTEELPLRGQLHLYVLTPEEFEKAAKGDSTIQSGWALSLLKRVGEGYTIIYEVPFGYARVTLASQDQIPQRIEKIAENYHWENPLRLPAGSGV